MSVTILVSAVAAGFQAYRPALRGDLQRHDIDMRVEGDFKPYGQMGLGEAEVEADRGVEDGGGGVEPIAARLRGRPKLVRRLFQNDGKFTSPRLSRAEAG